MSEAIISVDLGGTNIRAARLDEHLNIVERVRTDTNPKSGCAAIVARIKDQIRQVMPTDATPVAGIGISAPGPTNPYTGILVAPPNLGDCYEVPLVAEMSGEFGCETYLGNDANVAALAEAVMGAARGYRHVIYITWSTGIGGGILADGRLLLGKEGLAAEVGHIPLVVGDTVTTLEKEAAGPALARKARERIAAGDASLMRDMVGGDLDRMTGKVIGDAVQQGDKLALEIIEHAGFIFGLGIATMLHIFNPEVIVIGGGVSLIGEPLFEPMRAAYREHTIDRAYVADLQILPAELGDNVSIIGAGSLVITKGGARDVAAIAAELQN